MPPSTEARAARGRHAPPPEATFYAGHPEFARTLPVETVGAGPTALVSRQVRLGEAENVFELGPMIDGLIGGVLARGS